MDAKQHPRRGIQELRSLEWMRGERAMYFPVVRRIGVPGQGAQQNESRISSI
jgi:hypothetical protein